MALKFGEGQAEGGGGGTTKWSLSELNSNILIYFCEWSFLSFL